MTLSAVPPTDDTAGELAGDLDERRRRARRDASARLDAASVDPDSWSPRVAVVPFAPGAAVVALAGAFDRAGSEVLRAMTDEVDRVSALELVVDMTRVTGCEEGAARTVARWRIRRLAAGSRVELHGAPAAVRVELGQHATPF